MRYGTRKYTLADMAGKNRYKNAGDLDPSETMLLECHGTGTRVGDPIEVRAAGNVFGPGRSSAYEDRLMVGSVKTNVGHLEGACVLPGILKVLTALENGEIPPTLGVKTPNPLIDFDGAKARVVTEVEPWPQSKLKRASVTSAGFGGTNGHCVIDHVHNVFPDYIKPGAFGHQKNGINGTNGANGTNGVSAANGHGNKGVEGVHKDPKGTPALIQKDDAATRQLVVLPFSARMSHQYFNSPLEFQNVLELCLQQGYRQLNLSRSKYTSTV